MLTLRTPISLRATWTLTVLSVLAPLAGWWALSTSGLVQPAKYLPTPAATFAAGVEMAQSGALHRRLGVGAARPHRVRPGRTGVRAAGPPDGQLPRGLGLFEPIMGRLRYLPAAAFIPLLIIWLRLEEEPKVAIIFIGTFFFSTLMTADVVHRVPMALIDVSYTLGARTGEVVRKVVIPHALPGMIDAVRVNAAAAWSFVVVAGLIAPESGLGYRITRLSRLQQIDGIFAMLVAIGLIGLTIDVLLRMLRDRVGRWT